MPEEQRTAETVWEFQSRADGPRWHYVTSARNPEEVWIRCAESDLLIDPDAVC